MKLAGYSVAKAMDAFLTLDGPGMALQEWRKNTLLFRIEH